MTSRERLLAVLEGRIPDRVPISCYELVGYDSHNFCNREPSYRSLMDYIREKTDCICMWNPESDWQLGATAYVSNMEQEVRKLPDGHETITRYDVGGRTLTLRDRIIDGVYTSWRTEHLCKDSEDVDAVMSVPYVPLTYATDDIERIQAELGERGILMPTVSDPAYEAMALMEFGESMVWAMTETEHFAEVVDEMHKRVMGNLRRMLETTPGDLYRITGPEYMCPPYLPPSYFERFMLPYLSDMVQLIHSHGRKARIHCHGKVARVLDMIRETGCDGLDPCEETPDGDITLEELKARVGDKLCLFGSMQLKMLETSSTEEVIRQTRRMTQAGKPGGRFVLMPTASPINVPLSPKTEDNYKAFIDTALEYGVY